MSVSLTDMNHALHSFCHFTGVANLTQFLLHLAPHSLELGDTTQSNMKGTTTFSITTLSITTFSIMTFSIMTFSIMTFSIMVLFVTLSIKDSQHNDTPLRHKFVIALSVIMLNVVFSYCYAKCRSAEFL